MRRFPLPALTLCAFLLMSFAFACASGGGDPADTGAPTDSSLPDVSADRDIVTGCTPACASTHECREGRCVQVAECSMEVRCPSGGACCSGECVSLLEDSSNCGGCGVICDGSCNGGRCTCGEAPCGSDELCCGGDTCVDPSTDRNNCGDCGVTCAGNQICEDGMCVTQPCDPPCGPGETCDAETLTCSCGAGDPCSGADVCCDGICVDTTDSDIHCGSCGTVCGEDMACVDSECTIHIPCEPACPAGEMCMLGECRCGDGAGCSGGQTCCDGSCVSTATDSRHCGRCGAACGGGTACCASSCRNLSNDDDHCGSCGNACSSSRSPDCESGSCDCNGIRIFGNCIF